ncbi:MAG: hypothetical protein AB8C95_15895 [Phycisphaeraceae bacterium]
MIISISQMVSLVCYANAVVQTNQPIEFAVNDQQLHERYSFQFVFAESQSDEVAIARDMASWIEWLRQQGLLDVQLVFKPNQDLNFPDHETYQLPNLDAHWSMIIRCRDAVSLWTVKWSVGNESERSHPDYEPAWNIRYTGKAINTHALPQGESLEEVESRLWSAINSANEYAKTFHNTSHFIHWLEQGLGYLKCNEGRLAEYFPYWAKLQANSQAKRILAAADDAWVFGGMGSWNEPWYKYESGDENLYHAITTELYGALVAAIVTATNSTIRRTN